ncbi:MAG: pilus assembly protein PilM [Oscillospiraceae bacterium]|nr:pilus assembly protein PilM [Oscillospiraceae bacterium]
MLSFDVTDRKIRIIKGTESNGKIKISAAAEIALEEAVIVNGHVNDINRVAVLINQVLKSNNMPDKEAIVAISSNQTVFKELLITPNAKESEFMKEIRTQLQVQINVDDSYSVAYVIVGDPEDDENGEKKQKVLVTACPYDVVECYKRIFHMLGITLRTVMIGCNAITKVLLADSKVKAKMPLLAVQIDSDFISLNLYEDNQLSFSRFASIDPEDYDNPDDYVFEAVNENIFRMLQFARSRGSNNIENVVFYGDINVSPNLYNRLIDELAPNDLSVSQLTVPPQIHGYQNLEFSVYANAIGAMFKRNKLTEHINLLDTESAGTATKSGGANDKTVTIFAGVGLGLAALIVLGTWGTLFALDSAVKSSTAALRQKIDSPETAAKLQQYEDLLELRDVVNVYKENITTASDAYKSKAVVSRTYFDAIDESLEKVAADYGYVVADSEQEAAELEEGANKALTPAIITEVAYKDGVFTIPIGIVTDDEYAQDFQTSLVDYIYQKHSDLFSRVQYNGYEVKSVEDLAEYVYGEDAEIEVEGIANAVGFELKLVINNEKQMPDLELPEAEETAE